MSSTEVITEKDLLDVCAILPPSSANPPLGGMLITLDEYNDLFAQNVILEKRYKCEGWSDFSTIQHDDIILYERYGVRFHLKRPTPSVGKDDSIIHIVKHNHPLAWHRFYATHMDFFELQDTMFDYTAPRGEIIVPPRQYIFHAFHCTPPEEVSVVIFGQDPYVQEGYATGLAFSVPKHILKIPYALQKVYDELEREFPPNFSETGNKGVSLGKPFKKPAHGDLTSWTRKGVLLLNKYLTTVQEQMKAHAQRWEGFADAIIRWLCRDAKRRGVKLVFMLWGAEALQIQESISSIHLVLKASHPTATFYGSSSQFSGCNHFLLANEFLAKNDRNVIDWNVL